MTKVDFDYPTELRFQCTKCAICCGDTNKKTRHILLLGAEAQQIATATSQEIFKFATRIEGRKPYNYEMKKKTEDGTCLFLEKDRCVIYSSRPLICRFYPFELRIAAKGNHQFLFTNECSGIGKGRTLCKSYFEKLFRLARARARLESRLGEEKH